MMIEGRSFSLVFPTRKELVAWHRCMMELSDLHEHYVLSPQLLSELHLSMLLDSTIAPIMRHRIHNVQGSGHSFEARIATREQVRSRHLEDVRVFRNEKEKEKEKAGSCSHSRKATSSFLFLP